MSTTTIAAIRDRITTVLRGLTPTVFSSDRFTPYDNEERADFEPWANENPDASARMFQVRDTGEAESPSWSSSIDEERFARIRITIAYPTSNRWGGQEGLDRDDAIESDRYQIEKAVGLYGKPNFSTPYPNATWRPDPAPKTMTIRATACDFLIIEQTMSYFRTV